MTQGRNTEKGNAFVEYALLLALVAIICIVALATLGVGDNEPGSTPSKPPPTATTALSQ